MARTLFELRARPVTDVAGVGPSRAEALALVEPPIETVFDLVTHYPRRWIDRTNVAAIKDLKLGEDAVVLARVKRTQSRRTKNKRSVVDIDIFDGSSYLRCTFFNQPWMAKRLPVGTEAVFYGKLDMYKGRRQLSSARVDLVGDQTGRIVPMYPQSPKAELMTADFAKMIDAALRRIPELHDPLDDDWRNRLKMIDRGRALHQIHQPETMQDKDEARKRLAFDELLRLQLTMVMRKRAIERASKGIRHRTDGELLDRFAKSLPFERTNAQRRAIQEIADDLAGPHPMHRLLQGDVGSGKTLVAVSAMLMAVQGGYQAALMVPTEVLAEQHFASVRQLLEGLTVEDKGDSLFGERPLNVQLLTNRTTATERTRLHEAMVKGEVDVLIGTHALLTEGVEFHKLGVIVIDEQHRFGVEQRSALRGKGDDPDVLVMTATPIPRTLAMTVYGDLDVTVLDELPPGRTPIETMWAKGPLEESAAWTKVRSEVEAGHQAYVVCPLIEESEKIEARSAEDEFERLQQHELEGLRLGLLHGRVLPKDKEATMAKFRNRELDVLVATTVIEVGVDVPNATVMVIEDADRFGIAQLHQLRGRVGRGAAISYCFLLGEGTTPDSAERLGALEESTDGFFLAEKDLELRREGTILGTRQKGRSDLKLASLRRDKELVALARDTAFAMTADDPQLQRNPVLEEEVRGLVEPEEAEFLFKS
ncbi:MAG: ATP-dependent helicase RecG [Actinomycetota bacterium]|nr:ATP-dependent helicase RecG [Actinomycetota bacterium]